jgi:hypothetical protein
VFEDPVRDPSAAQPGTSSAGTLNDPYYTDVIGTISIRPSSSVTTTYTADIRAAAARRVVVSTVRKANVTVVKLADALTPRIAGWVLAGTILYQIRVTYFHPGTRTVAGSFAIANGVGQSVRSGGIGAATTPALEEVVFQQN